MLQNCWKQMETYSLHTYTLTQQAGNIYWKVVYVNESQGSATLSLSVGGRQFE